MMYIKCVVDMVNLDSQGCVWVVSCDLKRDDFGEMRVFWSFVVVESVYDDSFKFVLSFIVEDLTCP